MNAFERPPYSMQRKDGVPRRYRRCDFPHDPRRENDIGSDVENDGDCGSQNVADDGDI